MNYLLLHNINDESIPIFYSSSKLEIDEELKSFKSKREQELECLNEEDKSFEFSLKAPDIYITHGEVIWVLTDQEKIKEIINNLLKK